MTTKKQKATEATLPIYHAMHAAANDIGKALHAYKREENSQVNAFARLCQLSRRLKRVARKECSPAEVMEIAFLMNQALNGFRTNETAHAMFALDQTRNTLMNEADLALAKLFEPEPFNPTNLRLIDGGVK